MGELRDSIERILRTTGALGWLTALQRQEILDHLEDSAQQKLQDGVPPLEAVASSLEGLGDLGSIAREFEGAKPPRFSLEGWIARPRPGSNALAALCLMMPLLAVAGVSCEISNFSHTLRKPVPWLTSELLGLGAWAGAHPLLVGPILAALALAAGLAFRSPRGRQVVAVTPILSSAGLLAASLLELGMSVIRAV